MIVLKNGWNMEADGFVDGDYIVAKSLRIPIEDVLLFTEEGKEECVWTEDLLCVASEQRWWYAVYSWLHTVTSKLKRKVK